MMEQIHAPSRTDLLALGMRHHADGRLDEAEAVYQRLYASNPRDPDVLYLLGVLCTDLGLYEAAAQLVDRALVIAPRFPEARHQMAVALHGAAELALAGGAVADAHRDLTRALEFAPDHLPTRIALGRVALAGHDDEAAEACFTAALRLPGEHADTLNWLGLAQLNLGKYAQAETSLRDAARLRPDLNQAHNNLGLALRRQGRFAEARACFERALRLDPHYQPARINLADVLRVVGDPRAARAELDTVLAASPDAAAALNNMGAVLQDLGETHRALAMLTRALALSPASPQVRWNLALTQLQLGDFANGWTNFESRWEGCDHLRGGYGLPPARAWRGEELHGKRLLLWAEQGFGDTLQFIRFAQDLALKGATVSVVAPKELSRLLRSAPGVSAVVTQGEALPDYDLHCPLMSVPHRLTAAQFASRLHDPHPYLSAPADASESWRARLAEFPGLKVGVVWAGSARRFSAELAAVDARRSISRERLAPLLTVPGCSFFSVQKGETAASASSLGKLNDFSAEWRDFADTAAFVANLDLIVSVDTAVAHLAGALGRPVWLLNRFDSCWRWLTHRSDSPWYPRLRQFRQPQPGDWEPVIRGAAHALAILAAQHPVVSITQ